VQPIVPLGTDHPYDRVVSPIGGCNPWRALPVLVHVPRGDYGRRICGSYFISRNATATGTENKIRSLVRVISSGGLSSGYTVNSLRSHWQRNTTQVIPVNQISIAILAQGEN
jgi:hypothetical protein